MGHHEKPQTLYFEQGLRSETRGAIPMQATRESFKQTLKRREAPKLEPNDYADADADADAKENYKDGGLFVQANQLKEDISYGEPIAKKSKVKQQPHHTLRSAENEDQSSFQKNDEGNFFTKLSSKRRITLKKWSGKVLVDIREFYEAGGSMKPGRKGISLTIDQLERIEILENLVEDAIEQLEDGENRLTDSEYRIMTDDGSIAFKLSSKRRLTVEKWNSKILINVREWYDSDGKMKPGKKGIALTKDQWHKLTKMLPDIQTKKESL